MEDRRNGKKVYRINEIRVPKSTYDYINGPKTPNGICNRTLYHNAQQLFWNGMPHDEALDVLRSCVVRDEIPEREAISTISSAYRSEPREPIYDPGVKEEKITPPAINSLSPPQKERKQKSTNLSPVKDNPVEKFFRLMYKKGDMIRVVTEEFDEEKKTFHVQSAGAIREFDFWIRRIQEHGRLNHGDPGGGMLASINPVSASAETGAKAIDVTDFRYALIEFDDIPIEDQKRILVESNVPCQVVVHSGNRSIHAAIPVMAKDAREYEEKINILYGVFEEYGVDMQNKMPNRSIRIGGQLRGGVEQFLLNEKPIGAASFSEWLAYREIDSSVPEIIGFRKFMEFDPESDDRVLIGKGRWLSKGTTCIFAGESGIGKSSALVQMAMCWGAGRDFFGIEPRRPLKSLVIQAENDHGDMGEMVQGVFRGLNFGPREEELLSENLYLAEESIHTGAEFARVLHRLIMLNRPDVVWCDPLLSYLGDDIMKQKEVSTFLRHQILPILKVTEALLFFSHHAGKPDKDAKAKSHWQSSSRNYEMLGSSDIVNWARATMHLQQVGKNKFAFRLGKRGGRSGVPKDPKTGDHIILLKQSENKNICWLPYEGNEDGDAGSSKGAQHPPVSVKDASWIIFRSALLDAIRSIPESERSVSNVLYHIIQKSNIGRTTAWKIWRKVKDRIHDGDQFIVSEIEGDDATFI